MTLKQLLKNKTIIIAIISFALGALIYNYSAIIFQKETTISNNQDITFQYPEELSAQYVSFVDWPPIIKTEAGTYSCKTTPQEVSSMSDITSQRIVDNRTYCVNVKHEGAAGSVYSSYTYTTFKNGKLVNVSFTLRYPNCNNYDEEQSKTCTSEREAFDIDATVDRIVQTIK